MLKGELNREVLDALFSHIDQVVFIRDVRKSGFPIIYINDAYTRIWAYSKEELYLNPETFVQSIHPDDLIFYLKRKDEFLSGRVEMETSYRIIDANDKIVKIKSRTFLTKDEANIPQYIVGYAQDITDVDHHHATLMNLNATQDLIIQLLTQDLILPISGVKYLIRSANHQIRTKGKVENTDYITEVIQQLNEVMKILEDLLIYLEVQSNRVRFTYNKLDVVDELSSLVKKYEDLASRKGIKINVTAESCLLNTDIVHFHQIIGNILSNAIKFTPSNGVIDISIHLNQECIDVYIIDSGVGIPSELLNLVTEPFQGGRVGLDGERSLSIGLYISKKIMQLMGGDLYITSEVSKGTKVRLSFRR